MFEAIGEALFESVAGKVLLGVGLVLVVPVTLPVLRPITKQVVKTGLVLAGKAKEVAEETKEKWGDMAAEAQSELAGAAKGDAS